MEKQVESSPLSLLERDYLETIGDFGYVTQMKLPSLFGVSRESVGRSIKRLEEMGLVNQMRINGTPIRQESKIPLRRKVLCLTEKGRSLLGSPFEKEPAVRRTEIARRVAVFEYVAMEGSRLPIKQIRGKHTAPLELDGGFSSTEWIQADAFFTYERNDIGNLIIGDGEQLPIEVFYSPLSAWIHYPTIFKGINLIILCFSQKRKRLIELYVERNLAPLTQICNSILVTTFDELVA